MRLAAYCQKKQIDFICTPFDKKSLNYLAANTKMPLLKLASGEVTHGPLLLEAARTGMPIILSTGMSNLEEISVALSILHYGYHHAQGYPDAKPVTQAQLAELRDKVTILHCVSQYPAPVSATNLRAMDSIAEAFGLPVGLSDHSVGITMSVAAAARGASVLEKHFTFDTAAQGPDHAASLAPGELNRLVQAVRDVAAGMGDGKKICRPEEMNTKDVARRSVVAARAIAKGEVFSEDNLICKRPSSGPLMPDALWQLLGKPARQAYAADDFIQAGELAATAAAG
ncbi:MAG: N-acetylneuraminate synthase [Proteobacteria bacterium]|nr:N-acetylneuraminate synthase [Pseudomonadota bacterium]